MESSRPDDQKMKETLYNLNILDTPLEERFERITRLVCLTLGVPISAFSLIDSERQWFKSIQGLDVSETPIEHSFCAYTILGDDVMVVPDAKKDIRFSHNPLVNGKPNITFYAGCPVRAPDGRNIGSLCAIDNKAKMLTTDQVQALRDLAKLIESELKVAQLSKAQYDLINELSSAQRMLMIDKTTRLWNKSGMEDIIRREWSSAIRRGSSLAVVKAEIDDLETISGSPEAADHMIKEIGRRLLSFVKSEDSIGRTSAGRFLILLTDPPADIQPMIDQIFSEVAEKPVTVRGGDIPFTVSRGVAILKADISRDPFELIRSAQQALEEALATGGGKTVLHGR